MLYKLSIKYATRQEIAPLEESMQLPSHRAIKYFPVLLITVSLAALAQTSQRDRVLKVYEETFQHPSDASKFDALKGVLPRDGNYYIVEGDLQLTEQELQGYVNAQKLADEKRISITP